jgi:hypothetical protein
LLKKYFNEVIVLDDADKYIYCKADKPRRIDDAERREYLEKEFNIEYPGEYRHNQHIELLNVIMERVRERDG